MASQELGALGVGKDLLALVDLNQRDRERGDILVNIGDVDLDQRDRERGGILVNIGYVDLNERERQGEGWYSSEYSSCES